MSAPGSEGALGDVADLARAAGMSPARSRKLAAAILAKHLRELAGVRVARPEPRAWEELRELARSAGMTPPDASRFTQSVLDRHLREVTTPRDRVFLRLEERWAVVVVRSGVPLGGTAADGTFELRATVPYRGRCGSLVGRHAPEWLLDEVDELLRRRRWERTGPWETPDEDPFAGPEATVRRLPRLRLVDGHGYPIAPAMPLTMRRR